MTIPWRTDEELAADDAYEIEARRQQAFSKAVDDRIWKLRVEDAARAKIRVEQAAETNFADQFLTRSELARLPKPEPLISRVLPRYSYAILRGRDHSFKSFVAVDWACCLATGKPWQQHPVDPVRVLYIAGEGATGLAGRIDAWEYAWGEKVPDDMLTIRQTALNLHQPGPAFEHLLEHVTTGGYGLVIVDTLRRVSGAADGNSSEMGAVIDNLDEIKRATDRGSVLAVAHTDKGDHDTRGYSGIEDDADVVWSAKREDMFLTLQLAKFKDGVDGTQINLLAKPTDLDSLILIGADGTPEINTNESQLAILAALRVMPDGGVTGPDLMATADLKRPTFYRALDELIRSQQVIRTTTGRRHLYELPGLVDTEPTDPSATPSGQPPEDDETDDALPLNQEDE